MRANLLRRRPRAADRRLHLDPDQPRGVYKLDINQGNYISQDMVDKLKVGQTRQQVAPALGTPLVADAFHDNRWDYVYEFKRQGRTLEHRQFTVYFVDDKLARWEGDEMPPSPARSPAPVAATPCSTNR